MSEAGVNRFFISQNTEMLAGHLNNRYNPWPMYSSEFDHGSAHKPKAPLFGLCILVSILLHLGIAALLNSGEFLHSGGDRPRQQPTIVHLVDQPARPQPEPPSQPKPRELELDTPPSREPERPPVEPVRPTAPARLADRDQRVAKEQAPTGQDSRDQTPIPATAPQQPQAPARPASPAAERSPSPPAGPDQAASKPELAASPQTLPKELAKDPEGRLTPSSEAPSTLTQPKRGAPKEEAGEESPVRPSSEPPGEKLPTLAQLTQLSPATIARSQHQGRQERIKEREGVEKGDTVWLNLEKGLLISFFRRFRNQIEGVWNYPVEAARNEVQGTLLLKITVDREGALLDVELLSTSGSDILDYEAIEAVYRSAPYGPLPKQYPHPDLKIFAHFRYVLTGKYIYGR